MEDTLWAIHGWVWRHELVCVLILILLEDTLWVGFILRPGKGCTVLILILLEDTLWAQKLISYGDFCKRLNPYSIGRYSLRSAKDAPFEDGRFVLILILLEDTLWVQSCVLVAQLLLHVLILILLEDTLWEQQKINTLSSNI